MIHSLALFETQLTRLKAITKGFSRGKELICRAMATERPGHRGETKKKAKGAGPLTGRRLTLSVTGRPAPVTADRNHRAGFVMMPGRALCEPSRGPMNDRDAANSIVGRFGRAGSREASRPRARGNASTRRARPGQRKKERKKERKKPKIAAAEKRGNGCFYCRCRNLSCLR